MGAWHSATGSDNLIFMVVAVGGGGGVVDLEDVFGPI